MKRTDNLKQNRGDHKLWNQVILGFTNYYFQDSAKGGSKRDIRLEEEIRWFSMKGRTNLTYFNGSS